MNDNESRVQGTLFRGDEWPLFSCDAVFKS